jgi:hypothetical protein
MIAFDPLQKSRRVDAQQHDNETLVRSATEAAA